MSGTDNVVAGALVLLGAACLFAFVKALVRIGRVPMSDSAKAFWLLFVLLIPVVAVPLCFMQFKESDERLEPGDT